MKKLRNISIIALMQQKLPLILIETILLTGLTILFFMKVRPEDPFFITGPIPWIVFAPLLCALVFGAAYGLLSLAILVFSVTYFQQNYGIASFPIREHIVGICLLTIIPGLFGSFWHAQIRHLEQLNKYIREHLENLSREYYFLRISHERLEHTYLVKPLSLREAFYKVTQEINYNHGEINEPICETLLGICSQYSSINSAAFCTYNEKTQAFDTIAILGKPFEIDGNNALIKKAVNKRATVYISANSANAQLGAEYLAVIPLITTQGEIKAFIIIQDMPFWSLTNDNLEVMSVLASAFVLEWTTATDIKELFPKFPTCPTDFLKELQLVIQLKKQFDVKSAIAGIHIPACFSRDNILYSLENNKRSLDYVWILKHEDTALVITLLPLTSIEAMNGYKNRIANWLRSEFGEELNQNGFYFRCKQINDESPELQLDELITEMANESD